MEIYQKAYTLPTLTEATRYLVNALFGEYGLVVVDGNDKALKKQFSEIIKDELLNQNSFKLVTEQLKQLEANDYKQQAFPREINLFYLSKNSRERIEYDAQTSQYSILNTQYHFSKEEILAELENHPERFSPNVILRPLFQQKILPSLAYIGGAGELSYWLQLKPIFELYKVNFPQLILRNSALLINENTSKKIDKLGFQIQDFFNDIDTLKKEFIAKNTEDDIDVSIYKNELETTFNKLQELTKNIDATLVNTVGAELQKSLQSIDSIQKRLMKSLKQKNETELNQIEKIKTQLFPQNNLQERVDNFSSYYAKYGQQFIDDLIANFDVYNKQFLLIEV
ncbi:MAG: bacillithiol biosynthesis cysteine-adding enzyme BshC [Saprospirales bacterium]|nr:bacillithiol biosynthesis cysteine-adding enzyme BshC [Saprospirales bacterium]